MDEVGFHNILHGAGRIVVDWKGYISDVGLITCFTTPAILWFAGTIMGEVGAIT